MILVTDAGRGSALGIIRSLGRRGWRVIAADTTATSPGFVSKYARARIVYPDPERNANGCIEALRAAAIKHAVDLIIPVTDVVILPLSALRERFSGLCRLALPDAHSLEVATDKLKTFELAERLGVPMPRTRLVHTAEEACEGQRNWKWPVVLKPRSSKQVSSGRAIESFHVCYANDLAQLRQHMNRFEGHCAVLLQEYVGGSGCGVELLMDRGHPLAAFQHRRLREVPLNGGPSAFRESALLDPILYDYSVRLLREMKWTGLAMVEFKIAADGPRLMEINGRVWGSLPLAIHSGMDFPRRLAELLLYGAQANGCSTEYSVGVRSRNLELDLMWIMSVLMGRRRYPFLTAPRRREALTALMSMLNPRHRYDMQSWDDPLPGLVEIPRIARKFFTKLRGG